MNTNQMFEYILFIPSLLFSVKCLGLKQRTHEDTIVPLSKVRLSQVYTKEDVHPERDMCVVFSSVRGEEIFSGLVYIISLIGENPHF